MCSAKTRPLCRSAALGRLEADVPGTQRGPVLGCLKHFILHDTSAGSAPPAARLWRGPTVAAAGGADAAQPAGQASLAATNCASRYPAASCTAGKVLPPPLRAATACPVRPAAAHYVPMPTARVLPPHTQGACLEDQPAARATGGSLHRPYMGGGPCRWGQGGAAWWGGAAACTRGASKASSTQPTRGQALAVDMAENADEWNCPAIGTA